MVMSGMTKRDYVLQQLDKQYERTLQHFKQMSSSRIRRQVKNVLRLIKLSKNEDVLEVGVATGKFSSLISQENRVISVDISLNNLRRAQRAVKELGVIDNFFPIVADCIRLPFFEAMFDKVVAADIVEHLSNDVFISFCREAHRVLKRGGHFYIYTPNLLHPYELARPFRPLLRKEHIGVRTRAMISRRLKDEGFVIVESYFNNIFRRISIDAQKIL